MIAGNLLAPNEVVGKLSRIHLIFSASAGRTKEQNENISKKVPPRSTSVSIIVYYINVAVISLFNTYFYGRERERERERTLKIV